MLPNIQKQKASGFCCGRGRRDGVKVSRLSKYFFKFLQSPLTEAESWASSAGLFPSAILRRVRYPLISLSFCCSLHFSVGLLVRDEALCVLANAVSKFRVIAKDAASILRVEVHMRITSATVQGKKLAVFRFKEDVS